MENQPDSLSLQRTLLRVTAGLGGTWTPARAVTEDTSIKSLETRPLADGRTLVVETRVTVTHSAILQSHLMVMHRDLHIAAPGERLEAYGHTRLASHAAVACDFTDPDSILAAIDTCSEKLDEQCHALRTALEDAHV